MPPWKGPVSWCASQRVLSGSVGWGTSSATPLMRWTKDGDAWATHWEPTADTSAYCKSKVSCHGPWSLNSPRLMYETTFSRIQSGKSSAHSVLPTKPYYRLDTSARNQTRNATQRTSSASQLAMTKLRSGFQPLFSKAPYPRTNSWIETVPEVGSAAPMTQATDKVRLQCTSSIL